MADPIWYLGPAGDMRPLVCPERDIDITVERFGGVFKGLSGANSVDVTGHRQKFQFKFSYLDQAEFAWYEALHLRMFPGPYRLLNPLKKNRLTAESSFCYWGGGNANGVLLTLGVGTRVYDFPAAASVLAGPAATSLKWTNRSNIGVFRFDIPKRTTVIVGEQVTGSVWMKASATTTVNLIFDWWNKNSQISSSTVVPCTVTTAWQRFSITATVPAGIDRAQFAGYTSNTTNDIYIAASQFEQGSTATDWELGGGAPIVHVDQLATVSPRYPYRNVDLTILEA